MIRRIITLVIVSSVISAGLLYMGFTVMGRYSPAHASTLNALVVKTNPQISPKSIPAKDSVPLTVDPVAVEEISAISSTSTAISASSDSSTQSLPASVNSIPAVIPVGGVTIAQLLNSPDQYIHQVFTISGIATSLSNDKFLLNDGTGQILVEIEDDLASFVIINGQSITVMGRLDDSSSRSSFELDACTLTDQNGTVVMDDCDDDDAFTDTHDCLNDNCSDDCLNDDCSDDCSNDDCDDDLDDDGLDDDDEDDLDDDDDSDDDSDDDVDDDNEDDGEDD
jgi:uncharacterized protein YdeI (BOF family)